MHFLQSTTVFLYQLANQTLTTERVEIKTSLKYEGHSEEFFSVYGDSPYFEDEARVKNVSIFVLRSKIRDFTFSTPYRIEFEFRRGHLVDISTLLSY